ncbi:MAG: hypothetical protein GWP08_03595 [Nitrospiraceae bacterium]|nr:hypothetical protein [Nitrospiraceae bacterium]
MSDCRPRTLLAMAAIACIAMKGVAAPELGRDVKLTILVDKVMQPEEGWVTKEWMIKAAAEAGFNVFSPRIGHERLDEVRQVAQWCQQYGIYYMPWMRGTLTAPDDPKADGKRVLWASGNEQPLWSVNSDEFWAWTNNYIVEYAKIAAENPRLMGVFLDYENYAPGREGDLYSLSYDDLIMGKFAKSQDLELPKLPFDQRKTWLEARGLHEQFAEFQIAHWRERCRMLREAVDAYDPTFQFCIYPAPGTPFMVEAAYPEWATEAAPIILADASTYGRTSRFITEQEALAANRRKLLERRQVAVNAGVPFVYTGGIDPLVEGADPEFSGKNAVMISEVTDGYWIFYEGPTYTKPDHAAYWKWFSWANRAIARSDFDAQHTPRETPEDWNMRLFDDVSLEPILAALEPPPATGKMVEFPTVQLRRENLLLLATTAGEPVEVVLQHHPFADYESLLGWELRSPDNTQIAFGKIPQGGRGSVRFTPDTSGICALVVSSGSCAYSVASANVPVALYAGKKLGLIFGAEHLYFSVPEDVGRFTITCRGAQGLGSETVRATVSDAAGEFVATGQTTPTKDTVEIAVERGQRSAGTWSLATTQADEGILEDNSLTLDPQLPPVVSLLPQHVFRKK